MLRDNQSHIFNTPEHVTYFNIASQSPSFKAIHEAGLSGLLQKQHLFTISISDYFEPFKGLKTLFSQLIEAENFYKIALIPSVSYRMAKASNKIWSDFKHLAQLAI